MPRGSQARSGSNPRHLHQPPKPESITTTQPEPEPEQAPPHSRQQAASWTPPAAYTIDSQEGQPHTQAQRPEHLCHGRTQPAKRAGTSPARKHPQPAARAPEPETPARAVRAKRSSTQPQPRQRPAPKPAEKIKSPDP